MKIERTTDYGIRIILHLASVPEAKTSQISEELNIPKAYVVKVVRQLVERGFLLSRRGYQGGISLIPPPEKITIRQILEAMQGKIALSPCLIRSDHCRLNPTCSIAQLWLEIQNEIVARVDNVTIAELVGTKRIASTDVGS